MAEAVLMTALSPTMEEGTIVSWSKSEGSQVKPGDILCEVETDKATMDYESTQEGTLLKVIRGDGVSAAVGETIAIIGEKGEDIQELVEQAASAPVSEPPVAEGDSGPAASSVSTSGAGAPGTTTAAAAPSSRTVKASPLARRLAAERSININQVTGSGPGGRVVKRDIEGFSGAGVAAGSGAMAAMQPGHDVVIPVAGSRAVIARRMAESKFAAPHYYLKSSVRMEQTIAARAQLNSELPEKVSFNAFLLKFVAEALKKHPGINASWQGDTIVQLGSIDIGLAVDLGNGLITPIVRNCANRGVVDIDQELKVLISKAGEGKLLPEDYSGASFTISNLGSFGVEEFTGIINPPGSAILAIGQTTKTVVVGEDDSFEAAQVMKMTLSCDHRVIDGAAGGAFIFELKRIMESPVRALY